MNPRTGHIDAEHDFANGMAKGGQVELKCCSPENMIADDLTEALPPHKLEILQTKVNIVD